MTTAPLFFLPALQNPTGVKTNDKTERSQTVPKKTISKRSTNAPEASSTSQAVADAEEDLKEMEEEEERMKIKLSAAKERLAVAKEVAEDARRAEEAKEAKEAEAAEAASREYKAWQCVMIVHDDPEYPEVFAEINWQEMEWPQIINEDEVVTYGGVEVIMSEQYSETRDLDLASRDCYIQYQAALKLGSGKGEYRSRILFIGKYKPPVVPYGIFNMELPISTPMSIVDSVFAKVVPS